MKTEEIHLPSIKWAPAKGTGKWFLPSSTSFPTVPSISARVSREHKMKGFVDDITIISANCSEHQEILSFTDVRCREVNLCIRPQKCFSMVFDGKSVAKYSSFDVGDGQTTSIREHPTTFMGSTVCHSPQWSKRAASESFLKGFLTNLCKLDSTPVRGEYKVWIYKCYLVPSLCFKLPVNAICVAAIKKANAAATKRIK